VAVGGQPAGVVRAELAALGRVLDESSGGQLVQDGRLLGRCRYGSPVRGGCVPELHEQVVVLHGAARQRACRAFGKRDQRVPAELVVALEGYGHPDVVEDEHRVVAARVAQMLLALGRVAFAAAHERSEQRLVGGALRAVVACTGRCGLHGLRGRIFGLVAGTGPGVRERRVAGSSAAQRLRTCGARSAR